MFISHFNHSLGGGAATAARRLHTEQLGLGLDSRFYYSSRQRPEPGLDPSYQPVRWRSPGVTGKLTAAAAYRWHRQQFKWLTRGRSTSHELFTSPRGGPNTPWPPLGRRDATGDAAQQVIHLHWIARLIDYTSFFGSIDPATPIVWTLHDMNAFTGGCHFSEGCLQYRSGCGHCPQLPRCGAADLSRQFFVEKQAALANLNLHIAAPSRWLLDSARSSLMLQSAKSFHHVPYSISTSDYYPMERREARARLGIDPDATVFCFGAMDVQTSRKGAAEMLQALAAVADLPGVQGMVFGAGTLPATDTALPPIHQVGPVQGLLQQRALYSASDVFVLPSLEDNLPLTGLEAMACGTPIVGFNTGGIPDYVRPQETGLLAPTGDADMLGRQLRSLLAAPQRAAEMGRQARCWIEQQFADDREATTYRQLYATLLDTANVPQHRAA